VPGCSLNLVLCADLARRAALHHGATHADRRISPAPYRIHLTPWTDRTLQLRCSPGQTGKQAVTDSHGQSRTLLASRESARHSISPRHSWLLPAHRPPARAENRCDVSHNSCALHRFNGRISNAADPAGPKRSGQRERISPWRECAPTKPAEPEVRPPISCTTCARGENGHAVSCCTYSTERQ